MNPRSLANLRRGYVSPDPVIRSQRARTAGLARAKRSMTALERRVLQAYGMAGVQGFRLGLTVGKNQAYQAMRKDRA